MIRVFPKRTQWTPTDEMAFIGYPPFFRPEDPDIPVKISVTFTEDIPEAKHLYKAWSHYYRDVEIGGPGFGDPGGEFTPGMFLKTGVTITSRGCPRQCKWCFVPGREGHIRELEIKPGWIVQDNNLLACREAHIVQVFVMLQAQNRRIYFNGGLDARLLREWHVKLFDSIKIGELWFAADTKSEIKSLRRISDMLTHYKARQKRCYALIGFNGETIQEARKRLETIYDLGFWPYAQLYRDGSGRRYELEWTRLQHKWQRPAEFKK